MPSGMPTDAYLSTFETNSHAARALFWARTGSWRFADWRNKDLDKLSEQDEASLGHAIEQEALVTDADLERMLKGYHSLMDPRVPVHYCGACGTTDVPISGTSAPAGAAERMHIESFSRFLFTDPILVPLRYTPDQNALFESGPGHVNMTLAGNRELWLRYRRAISAVDVSTDGTASAPLLCRLHLYPDLPRARVKGKSPFNLESLLRMGVEQHARLAMHRSTPAPRHAFFIVIFSSLPPHPLAFVVAFLESSPVHNWRSF